jgi:hypothetical protein
MTGLLRVRLAVYRRVVREVGKIRQDDQNASAGETLVEPGPRGKVRESGITQKGRANIWLSL